MPFMGKNKSTGEILNILTIDDPRKVVKKSELVCPLCDQSMTVVAGLVRLKHFRHLSGCTTPYERHPESIQHLLGKAYVRELLLENYPDSSIKFEVVIPECNRVADVLLEMDGGWRIAHEIQLANITTFELRERTKSYNEKGIDVTWWLGGTAYTPANCDWVEKNFGEVRILQFARVDSVQDQRHWNSE